MKEKGFLQVLLCYIKDHKKIIVLDSVFIFIFVIVFYLYALPLESILYGFLLSGSVGVGVIFNDFIKYYRKHKQLCILEKQITSGLDRIPPAKNLIEASSVL